MPGNGKVFISHAHEDNDRCAPLLAALDAWGVDYWFDTLQMHAGQGLSDRIQKAIADATIFIRVCTPAAQASFWVSKETGAFIGLQAVDHKAGKSGQRTLIPLRLDTSYSWQPFELDTVYIDAAGKPQRAWLDDLRNALADVIPALNAPAPNVATSPAPVPTSMSTKPTHVSASIDGPPDVSGHPVVSESASSTAIASAGSSFTPVSTSLHATPRSLVVDPSGAGDHATISAALRAASPHDRILVRQGTYQEALVIDKSIEIAGDSKHGDVIIQYGGLTRVIVVQARDVLLTNLSLRGMGLGAMDVVKVDNGGDAVIESCDISSTKTGFSGIWVTNGKATIRRNNIHDCGLNGVVLERSASEVLLEDNDITRCSNDGIHLKKGAQAIARRNRITDNEKAGIRADDGAYGIFEDNDLRRNAGGAWRLGNPNSNLKRERNLEE